MQALTIRIGLFELDWNSTHYKMFKYWTLCSWPMIRSSSSSSYTRCTKTALLGSGSCQLEVWAESIRALHYTKKVLNITNSLWDLDHAWHSPNAHSNLKIWRSQFSRMGDGGGRGGGEGQIRFTESDHNVCRFQSDQLKFLTLYKRCRSVKNQYKSRRKTKYQNISKVYCMCGESQAEHCFKSMSQVVLLSFIIQ